jgi:hypothetical protein
MPPPARSLSHGCSTSVLRKWKERNGQGGGSAQYHPLPQRSREPLHWRERACRGLMIGLAGMSGTDVDPTCSMRNAHSPRTVRILFASSSNLRWPSKENRFLTTNTAARRRDLLVPYCSHWVDSRRFPCGDVPGQKCRAQEGHYGQCKRERIVWLHSIQKRFHKFRRC